MQTEPMNVDTKDLTLAEALELAIAETRLALCELGDAADAGGEGVHVCLASVERAYQKVDAGLDRCKASADGLAAYSRVLEMANNAAGEQLRRQREEITQLFVLRGECEAHIERLEMDLGIERRKVVGLELQAKYYDRRPVLISFAWGVGLVLLGAIIEAVNGLLVRVI